MTDTNESWFECPGDYDFDPQEMSGGHENTEGPAETPLYAELGYQIGRLVEEKQVAYGDSFGKAGAVLEILYPDGVTSEAYTDLLTVTRVIDKLFRVASSKAAFGESPWKDIAGYAILAAERDERTAPNPYADVVPNCTTNWDEFNEHAQALGDQGWTPTEGELVSGYWATGDKRVTGKYAGETATSENSPLRGFHRIEMYDDDGDFQGSYYLCDPRSLRSETPVVPWKPSIGDPVVGTIISTQRPIEGRYHGVTENHFPVIDGVVCEKDSLTPDLNWTEK